MSGRSAPASPSPPSWDPAPESHGHTQRPHHQPSRSRKKPVPLEHFPDDWGWTTAWTLTPSTPGLSKDRGQRKAEPLPPPTPPPHLISEHPCPHPQLPSGAQPFRRPVGQTCLGPEMETSHLSACLLSQARWLSLGPSWGLPGASGTPSPLPGHSSRGLVRPVSRSDHLPTPTNPHLSFFGRGRVGAAVTKLGSPLP